MEDGDEGDKEDKEPESNYAEPTSDGFALSDDLQKGKPKKKRTPAYVAARLKLRSTRHNEIGSSDSHRSQPKDFRTKLVEKVMQSVAAYEEEEKFEADLPKSLEPR